MVRRCIAPDRLADLDQRLTAQTQIPKGFRHLHIDAGTVWAQSKGAIERSQSWTVTGITRTQRLSRSLGQNVEVVDGVNPLCLARQLDPLLWPLRLAEGGIKIPRQRQRKHDDPGAKTGDCQQRREDRSARRGRLGRPDPAHGRAQNRRERYRDARHLQPEIQQVVGQHGRGAGHKGGFRPPQSRTRQFANQESGRNQDEHQANPTYIDQKLEWSILDE